MKALVYEGMKKIKLKQVIEPSIQKKDDIIVKVTSTAICGSDLHLYHGLVPKLPHDFVLGHETMGTVIETGSEVVKVKKGDRVIVPFPISCGHCWYCEHELWSQCDNSNPNGEIGGIFGCGDLFGGYMGGQAEYLRVPFANVGPKIVEEELSDEQVLFLTDILPTAYWGVLNAQVKKDDTVVVLGCGPLGLLAIKMVYFFGASRIIAVDCVDYRLNHAKKQYGVETVNFQKQKMLAISLKKLQVEVLTL